jgi:hypothetical protein
MLPIFRSPVSICPDCGEELSAAMGATNDTPSPIPGDVSVCSYCSEVLIFSDSLALQVLSQKQLEAIYQEDKNTFFRIMDAQRKIRLLNSMPPNSD